MNSRWRWRLPPPSLLGTRMWCPFSAAVSPGLRFLFATLLCVVLGGLGHAGAAPDFKRDRLRAMDEAIETAVTEGRLPGGVLWLEQDGQVYRKAYGARALEPRREKTRIDTVYDAASLTKVIATTTAVMQLVERGQLELDAPVTRYLPAFGLHGKDAITVRQLLTHVSGLRPDVDLKPAWTGYETGVDLACRERLRGTTGFTFIYSDINFIVLGELVRVITGDRLDVYADREIFRPIGMSDTGFNPSEKRRKRSAPTERQPEGLLHGVVHDPTARAMDGVAGHAGLFTTASDLARYCRMLLADGRVRGRQVLRPETIREMTRVQTSGSDRRGLGWDIDSSFSGPRGRWFPAGTSFGHTGFTGTLVWVDPGSRTFLIFLSNRVHPNGKGDIGPLRRTLGTLAAEAVSRDTGAVLNGIDVLVRDRFAPLHGLRVGLITNQSGRDRDGRSTIDLLKTAPGVQLVALFSPEHGIRGQADAALSDTIDERTGLPIYSLYGATPPRQEGQDAAAYDRAVIRARAPKAEHLRGLDALVIDLQDIGARFYTYSATLGTALEAAARAGVRVVVLDRVNPIAGAIEGPVMSRPPSFIGFHPMPVRHGLTLGELARLYDRELGWRSDLVVVRCEGWTRDRWMDDAGLAWVNPSPSMRSLTAATLYPGLCLLEGPKTRISMGRGTVAPFEQIGAPFVEPERLAQEMNQAALPGVRFEPVRFTPRPALYPGPPEYLPYRDELCGGVRVVVLDRNRLAAVDVGIQLALTLARLYPDRVDLDGMTRLLGDDPTLAAIKSQRSLAEIKALWSAGLAAYRARIEPCLLYSEP
ncbi:MAG: DUF1343 domain-containing protein [Opitutaceae bacterium]|nr:DUF1343 domain-containing protein [Opitutaceae bacterium]